MTVRLIDANLNEMKMDIPMPSLSTGGGLEKNRLVIDNHYASASFEEIRTPGFSITDACVRCHRNLKIYSCTEENDMIRFCAALQGHAVSCGNPPAGEETWQKGQANMFAYSNVNGYACFTRDKPFRMMEIMLSCRYLERVASLYAGLFDEMLEQHANRRFTRAFPEHRMFCPAIGRALGDLSNYESAGNAAQMYLDAKVLEILSLFLCRSGQKTCDACNCYSPKDSERLIHAREIIERQYLAPPSLHRLALMVGTNECKLKHGFKILFGTTVFGFLFDYRMTLAARYLLDTEKTILDIAESVGYGHQSHFATAFRRKFSVSPQEYRSGRK
jgi:AraC-like DNA-binding protein